MRSIKRGVVALNGSGVDRVTRYLCAATYLDPTFANLVVDETVGAPRRAVAPSFGFNLEPVIRHALASQRLMFRAHLGLIIACVVALIMLPSATLYVLALVLTIGLTVRALVNVFRRRWGAALLYFIGLSVISPALLLLAAAAFWSQTTSTQPALYPLTPRSTEYLPTPPLQDARPDGGALVLQCVFVALLLVGATFTHLILVQSALVNNLGPGSRAKSAHPSAPDDLRDVVARISAAQHGNATLYSDVGREHPFIGAGPTRYAWSITSALKMGGPPSNGVTVELNNTILAQAIREGLRNVQSGQAVNDADAEVINIEDRAFVSGRLSPDSPFVSRRGWFPYQSLTPEDVARFIVQPPGRERIYQTIQILSWSGELVVTCYVRSVVSGGFVSLDFSAAVLPPLREAYRRVDNTWKVNPLTVSLLLGTAVLRLPGRLLEAPAYIGGRLHKRVLTGSASRLDTVALAQQASFDYGARVSVREAAAGNLPWTAFPMLDADRQVRLVQRLVIDGIRDTLVLHGYSAADFDNQATVVNHSSVSFLNSTFNNSAVAVGQSSSANLSAQAAATSTKGE